MTGRQGTNKGKKGKPGFQPVVGKGKKAPKVSRPRVSKKLSETVATSSQVKKGFGQKCFDPHICHVQVHRPGTVCRAYEQANMTGFALDSQGLVNGYTPDYIFTMFTTGNKYANGTGMGSYPGINVDVDYYRPCSQFPRQHPECTSEMCRCGIIVDTKVNVYSSRDLSEYFLRSSQLPVTIQDTYVLTTLLDKNNIHSPDLFKTSVRPGMFGEELEAVYFDNSSDAARDIWTAVQGFLTSEQNDRVRYMLESKNGYVPPELWEADFRVEKINSKMVLLPEEDLRDSQLLENLRNEAIDPNTGDHYADALVKGVVVPAGSGKYKLLDGKHTHTHTKPGERATYIVGRH